MNFMSSFSFDDFDGYDDCPKDKYPEGCLLDDDLAEWWDPDDYPPDDEGDEEHC